MGQLELVLGTVEVAHLGLSAFDKAMRRYVLKDDLVRVKLWDSKGRIVYSDEPRLIGARLPR